jgi:hypothetical protein
MSKQQAAAQPSKKVEAGAKKKRTRCWYWGWCWLRGEVMVFVCRFEERPGVEGGKDGDATASLSALH